MASFPIQGNRGCIRVENHLSISSHTLVHCFPFFTVGVLWPGTSGCCFFDFPSMMDYNLGLGANKLIFPLVAFCQYLIKPGEKRLGCPGSFRGSRFYTVLSTLAGLMLSSHLPEMFSFRWNLRRSLDNEAPRSNHPKSLTLCLAPFEKLNKI